MSRYQVDIAPVDQKSAASLVVHHLALAMGYFQALPTGDEREALADEIAERFQGFNLENRVASTFADKICEEYDGLGD